MTADEHGGAARRPGRRRRHRRVDAAPTNPEADTSDDVPPPASRPLPDVTTDQPEDPRDAWIREQRPPHWD